MRGLSLLCLAVTCVLLWGCAGRAPSTEVAEGPAPAAEKEEPVAVAVEPAAEEPAPAAVAEKPAPPAEKPKEEPAPVAVAEKPAEEPAAAAAPAGEPTIALNKIGKEKKRLFFVSSRYFVRNWALLGPFFFEPSEYGVDKIGSVVDHKFVPNEGNLHPVEGREVKDGRKWLLYTSVGMSPEVVDLDAFYGSPDQCVAYAVAYVHSENDVENCVLLCGSDDFIRVWVNGKMVHTYNEARRATEPDQDKVTGVNLKKGWNRVVVKCVDVVYGWDFVLRFAPPTDDPEASVGGYRMEAESVKPKFSYEPVTRPAAPKPGKVLDTIDLTGMWKLKADPGGVSGEERWNEPITETGDWKEQRVPGVFDETINLFEKGKLFGPFAGVGLTDEGLYNGIVWLRKDASVPANWKGDYRYFLELGRVDDMDITYVNGHKVGQTDSGTNPQDYWEAPRVYELHPDFLRFGEQNTIAVMVLDNNGEGGIFGPTVRLVRREAK